MKKIQITENDICKMVKSILTVLNENNYSNYIKPLTVLWLDDVREPEKYVKKTPKNVDGQFYKNITYYKNLSEKYKLNFVWVKTYNEFINYIKNNPLPDMVSFDHDLHDIKKGAACASWLKAYCEENGLKLPKCYAHSGNPCGRKQIRRILGCE